MHIVGKLIVSFRTKFSKLVISNGSFFFCEKNCTSWQITLLWTWQIPIKSTTLNSRCRNSRCTQLHHYKFKRIVFSITWLIDVISFIGILRYFQQFSIRRLHCNLVEMLIYCLNFLWHKNLCTIIAWVSEWEQNRSGSRNEAVNGIPVNRMGRWAVILRLTLRSHVNYVNHKVLIIFGCRTF